MIDSQLLPVTDEKRTLRALQPQDAPRFAEGTRDGLVREFGHLPEPVYTVESVERLAQTVAVSGFKDGSLALLSIVDPDDRFLGSLVVFDITDFSAEVGFWLHPDARGYSHARGALDLASEWAEMCGLKELRARTAPENEASQRNLERSGFALIGRDVDRAPSQVEVEVLHYRRPLVAEHS
ncbi:GNAT family N-acetyltransferase [Brevibacterium sp. LE-L]|uniref:GNAT family N-acetyltransferase n=1 Tax=Brevibacterium sp. LE-L TaxID=3418557 RepID=UPI003CF57A4F